jgi:hypothetical protein
MTKIEIDDKLFILRFYRYRHKSVKDPHFAYEYAKDVGKDFHKDT